MAGAKVRANQSSLPKNFLEKVEKKLGIKIQGGTTLSMSKKVITEIAKVQEQVAYEAKIEREVL